MVGHGRSRHRIFVTDVHAEAVHVFDFANLFQIAGLASSGGCYQSRTDDAVSLSLQLVGLGGRPKSGHRLLGWALILTGDPVYCRLLLSRQHR